jgi:hypothetical protein
MQTYSNKSKKAKSKAKTNKISVVSGKDTTQKPTFRVEEISNGFVVEKSWYDGDKYHCVKKYSETNPLED